jgi:putative hydrolase of the HAD superfamily
MKPEDFIGRYNNECQLIFDLDNTVYDENTFLFSTYKSISELVVKEVGGDSSAYYKFLCKNFMRSSRDKLLDKFLSQFDLLEKVSISDLLSVYRNPSRIISLRPFDYFLKVICLNEITHIITNGNPLQQKIKLHSLFGANCDRLGVVYANMSAPKPEPLSFLKLNQHFKFDRPVYIGDSNSDAEFSSRCGIEFSNFSFARDDDGLAIESTIDIQKPTRIYLS